jgi:hypothetical protein
MNELQNTEEWIKARLGKVWPPRSFALNLQS